jgi:ferredoxin
VADPARRVPDNTPGPFYVDRECIDCDLCREVAPENFQRNEDEGYSFVVKQPETDDERKRCEEARDSCPVEAIGNDGVRDEAPAPNPP